MTVMDGGDNNIWLCKTKLLDLASNCSNNVNTKSENT